MCCSFNKEKADEMFMAGRYRENLKKMIAQDETNSVGDSKMPDW